MAYLDYDPSLDFDAQEQQMVQAAARIKALRAMDLSTDINQPKGFKSAVTGAEFLAPTIKKPFLASATPLIQDTVASQMDKELAQNRSTMSQADRDFFNKWYSGEPKPTTETVQEPLPLSEPKGSFVGTPEQILKDINGIPDEAGRAAALKGYENQLKYPDGMRERTVTTPPTRESMMKWTASGMQGGPLAKALAAKMAEHQLIKEPELAENRAARLHERQLALDAARATKESEQNFRQSIVSQQLDSHKSIAQMQIDAMNERARERAQDKADAKDGDKASNYQIDIDPITGHGTRINKLTNVVEPMGKVREPKPPENLPAAEQTKFINNNATLDSINAILNDKKNDDATGLFKGLAMKAAPIWGTKLVNRWSTLGEQDRRVAIASLAAIEVHRLYGSAQTLGEVARAGGFLPEPTDSPEQIQSKLTRMRDVVNRENDAIRQMAVSQKYRMPDAVNNTGGATGQWNIREK